MKDALLHIPESIRFECTGCGNCCMNWPVPLTTEDVSRISALQPIPVGSTGSSVGKDSLSFKELSRGGDLRYSGFSHTMEKRHDGRCAFLTEANRCSLHEQHGSDTKPAMCRLFPYAFNETPDGIFVYVSFASTGVLYNSGRPLTEQRPVLTEMFELYQSLFPKVRKDWSKLQWLDGFPMTWIRYREVEQQLLSIITTSQGPTIQERILGCSDFVVASLPAGANPHNTPPMPAKPEIVDRLLLRFLSLLYLPRDLFGETELDLDGRQLMASIGNAPDVVPMPWPNENEPVVDLERLRDFKLMDVPIYARVQELLQRFIYARVFSKLYFGPGYGHFSLLSGVHHLYFIVLLVLIHIKQLVLVQGSEQVSFEDCAEVLRTVERRWIQINLSQQSCLILEVLLGSPERLRRLCAYAD